MTLTISASWMSMLIFLPLKLAAVASSRDKVTGPDENGAADGCTRLDDEARAGIADCAPRTSQ